MSERTRRADGGGKAMGALGAKPLGPSMRGSPATLSTGEAAEKDQ